MTTRAGSTVHARYGRNPCPWRARGSLQTSGARVPSRHAPHVGAISGVGLRRRPATPALSAGATATLVATLIRSGWRDGPRVLTGTRETARARTVAPLPLLMRFRRTPRSCVKRRTAASLRTLSRPLTEATKTTSLGLSKNPVRASSAKDRAIPCGISSDRPP
jgi:hypothetical protein